MTPPGPFPPLADVLSAYWRQLIIGGIPVPLAEELVRQASEQLVAGNQHLLWSDLVAAAPDPSPTAVVVSTAEDTTASMPAVDLWSDLGSPTVRQ